MPPPRHTHPDPGGLFAIFGVPWFIEASPQSLPPSSHGILPVYLCTQMSPLYKDTSHFGLRTHPTPI